MLNGVLQAGHTLMQSELPIMCFQKILKSQNVYGRCPNLRESMFDQCVGV